MSELQCALSVDVEDWFHILGSPAVPNIAEWQSLESRVHRNMERLLDVLAQTEARATFFWLGWLAERHPTLVRECRTLGHEVASHGYGHLLAYEAGCQAFREDVLRAKNILEDILGERIAGYRAPGFSVTDRSRWAFDVIREAGHRYDSSVFPARRMHGGLPDSPLGCYFIHTPAGALLEWPVPAIEVFGRRFSLFGGGYLRLAPKWLIRWAVEKLRATGQALLVYLHPRDLDPGQPHLDIPLKRRIACYANTGGTVSKLRWLCQRYRFRTMGAITRQLGGSAREGLPNPMSSPNSAQ